MINREQMSSLTIKPIKLWKKQNNGFQKSDSQPCAYTGTDYTGIKMGSVTLCTRFATVQCL